MSATVNEADREAARGLCDSRFGVGKGYRSIDVDTCAQVIADAREGGAKVCREERGRTLAGWGHK